MIDILCGFIFGHIVNNIDQGGTGRNNYICNKVSDDFLIFGSSRAENHYNAKMIEDSLGISCYNCGESGCGIILNYARLKMIQERKHPQIIIYEITPNYDYLEGNNNQKYLYRLKTMYNRPGIDSIFWDIDKTEKYKMLSQLYRHNSSFLQNTLVYFTKISTDTGIKGFRPIKEPADTMKLRKGSVIFDSKKEKYVFDPLKIDYIHKFIKESKNSKLVFAVSPVWYGQDTAVLDTIKSICQMYNIPIYDFSNDKKYVHINKYFYNGKHLNAFGADEFTKDLIHILKKDSVITSL